MNQQEFRARAHAWFMPERHPLWVAGSLGILEQLATGASIVKLDDAFPFPTPIIRPFRPLPQIHHDPPIGPTSGDLLQAVCDLAAEAGVDLGAKVS